MTPFLIRPVLPADALAWAAMRADLWPEDTPGGHAREVADLLRAGPSDRGATLVAEGSDGELVGFVELSVRNYAEDCETDRVGYCEGWYVKPAARRAGVGRALMAAGVAWARARGCTEFGSDALLENTRSHTAHKALGFVETCRIVCFKLRAELGSDPNSALTPDAAPPLDPLATPEARGQGQRSLRHS